MKDFLLPKEWTNNLERLPANKIKVMIQQELLDLLFSKELSHTKEFIEHILQRNIKLLGFTHYSFVYRKEPYGEVNTKPERLHPSLHTEMDQLLLSVEEAFRIERPYATHAITSFFNKTASYSDAIIYFPEPFHSILFKYVPAMPVERKLTDEELCALAIKNAKYLDVIRVRLMTNLII